MKDPPAPSVLLLTVAILALAGWALAARAPGAGAERRWPADAGLIDVTQAPYNAIGDGRTDSTAAIQKAIDSGKSTLYFPHGRGKWILNGTVQVRGNVRRIIGAAASSAWWTAPRPSSASSRSTPSTATCPLSTPPGAPSSSVAPPS